MCVCVVDLFLFLTPASVEHDEKGTVIFIDLCCWLKAVVKLLQGQSLLLAEDLLHG